MNNKINNLKDKILELFFKEPEKEFYVREIARILQKSPATISKYLKEMKKNNILESEEKFNHLIFKAADTEKFRQEKLNYNLNLINNSGLIDFLVKEYDPEAIVLFGSFAKSENTKKSDIDLFIISSRKKQINIEKFESKLGYKVQLFIHSKQEIEKIKQKNPELINNWINGIKLYGFLEIFE